MHCSRTPQAASFGSEYRGFSGTDLVERRGHTFLIASPTVGPAELYRGCLVFPVKSLDPAALETEGDVPKLALRVDAGNTIHGACADARSSAGLFLGVYSPFLPNFGIFATGREPGQR